MKRGTATAILMVAVVAAFVLPASASHVSGCPHRPTVWDGTDGNDCASDGDGSNDNWTLKAGDDLAFGESGRDIIAGDGGEDRLDGGNGVDFLHGGDGHDRLYEFGPSQSSAHSDELFGDDGNDYIECGGGADTCRGGGQTVGGEDVLFHCHVGGEADSLSGFEVHVHTSAC